MVLKDIIDNNGNIVVNKGSVLGSFSKLLTDQMMTMLKISSDYLDDGYIGISQVFGNNDDAITVLNSTLSSIKRTLYLNQAKLDVVLEVKDGINTSSQESKQQILKGAKDYTATKYLDINLVRYLTVSDAQDEGKEIHELTNKIKAGITIPKELLNVPERMTRTYYLVRNHNGKVEILEGTFDANTKVSVFETDQFSDYALVYKDEKIKTNTETTPIKKEETVTKDTTKKTETTTMTVNTSDNTNVLMYVALTIVAMLGIAVTVRRKVSR